MSFVLANGDAVTPRLDMAGVRIGGVTGVRPIRVSRHLVVWLWECSCGMTFERSASAVKLAARRHGTTSCGCLARAAKVANGKANRTHGFSVDNRRLYDVHRHMMRRCYHDSSKDFPRYGGRGIVVCDEWHDIAVFMQWARESGYAPDLTIERKDVNLGYCPANCTWIVNEKQPHNREVMRRLTYAGETLHAAAWARRVGIPYTTIQRRLRAGWGVDAALTVPPVVGRNQTYRGGPA